MLFMILCRDRPDAAALRQQTRPAHLDHIAPLAAAGRVRVAGPLLSDDTAEAKPCGSLIVADFADLAAAQAWSAADPYAQAGVFATVEIQPLRQVLP